MQREVLNTVGLGLSMMGGVLLTSFCCINPLDHTETGIEQGAMLTLAGALCGAFAWKFRQWWRTPPRTG